MKRGDLNGGERWGPPGGKGGGDAVLLACGVGTGGLVFLGGTGGIDMLTAALPKFRRFSYNLTRQKVHAAAKQVSLS